jgi:hypothetical protein
VAYTEPVGSGPFPDVDEQGSGVCAVHQVTVTLDLSSQDVQGGAR